MDRYNLTGRFLSKAQKTTLTLSLLQQQAQVTSHFMHTGEH